MEADGLQMRTEGGTDMPAPETVISWCRIAHRRRTIPIMIW